MTQEEKELLLKDLSARLPYGVKIELTWWVMGEGTCINTTLEPDHIEQLLNDEYGDTEIKPYLRPLSSMTEEEFDDMFNKLYSAQEEFFRNCSNVDTIGKIIANDSVRYDYLNKKMFDYRGLIPKGLAIEASEGMYGLPLTFK